MPSSSLGSSFEECRDVLAVELPELGEHPQSRAELRSERRQALREEIADAFARIGKLRPGHAIARGLDRELEVVRHGSAPRLPSSSGSGANRRFR